MNAPTKRNYLLKWKKKYCCKLLCFKWLQEQSLGYTQNSKYKCFLRDQFLQNEKLNQTHSKAPEAWLHFRLQMKAWNSASLVIALFAGFQRLGALPLGALERTQVELQEAFHVCFTCCRSLQVPLRGAKRQQKTKGSCSYGRHALEEFIFPIFPVTACSVFATR